MLQSPAFGLWLLSCLLTPCARGSPDSDWLQWGGEGSSSKPMALQDQGSAALPHAHTALAWGPSPPPHTCVHSQILVQINTWLLLCGQIQGSSSWREKWMSKQKQQAEHHQPCSRSLLLLSIQAARYTHQTGTLLVSETANRPTR